MADQPQPRIDAFDIDHRTTLHSEIRIRQEFSSLHCACRNLTIEPL